MSFRSIVRDVRDGIGSLSRRSFDVRLSGHHRGKSNCSFHYLNEQPLVIQSSRWAGLPPELLCDVIKRLEESESTWPARSHALLVENGKFLLSAKRTRRTTCTEYVISMDAGNISRSSNTYIGKLRSNFLGTKFIVYDTQPPHAGALIPQSSGRPSRRFYSKKVSPKVPTGSFNIAQVAYELNVLGTRGPRRMHCTMHSIPSSSLEPGGSVPGQPELAPRALEDSFRSISFSKSMDHSMEFSSSRFSDIGGSVEGEVGKERPLVLKNKAPRWHEQLQCWCLNFRGRVTVASVKNFQLIAGGPGSIAGPGGAAPSQPVPTDHDKIILQFGKVAKDMFTMDYRYPLSAFQAFAICLSSFDTKLACE